MLNIRIDNAHFDSSGTFLSDNFANADPDYTPGFRHFFDPWKLKTAVFKRCGLGHKFVLDSEKFTIWKRYIALYVQCFLWPTSYECFEPNESFWSKSWFICHGLIDSRFGKSDLEIEISQKPSSFLYIWEFNHNLTKSWGFLSYSKSLYTNLY